MERDRAMLIIERHQPAPLWRLLGIRRCTSCRRRWPCLQYHDARTNLLNHDRADIAALAHQRNSRWSSQ